MKKAFKRSYAVFFIIIFVFLYSDLFAKSCSPGLIQYNVEDICGTKSRVCCANGGWSDWNKGCEGASNCASSQCWNGKECEAQIGSCPKNSTYIQTECLEGKGWLYYCRCKKGNVVAFGNNDELPKCPSGEIRRVTSGRRYQIAAWETSGLKPVVSESLLERCRADFLSRTKGDGICKESELDCDGAINVNWNCNIADESGKIKMLKAVNIEVVEGKRICSYGTCKTEWTGWCNYTYQFASCTWY